MSRRTQEAEQQHLLLIVESAQRAGFSEDEIDKIVVEAVAADVEQKRAA
jgi:hypothetical protein